MTNSTFSNDEQDSLMTSCDDFNIANKQSRRDRRICQATLSVEYNQDLYGLTYPKDDKQNPLISS